MPNPIFPALLFSFAAMVLLLFASVSPPVWDKISFLDVRTPAGETVFGVFGMCIKHGQCSHRSVGYALSAAGAANVNLNSTVLHNLTYTLILHPIAGFLAFLSLVFGLLGIAIANRILTILMSVFAFLGAFIGLVVFVIDMVLWNVLKNRLHDADISAKLGNANWLTVAAVFALFLSTCTAMLGAFGRFATGRAAGEKY
ncbi:pH-response regulator protein palI/RIM9 [Vanrija pseudolonga]|uniref:PH-response regulator protein palI/RIM9 n=1 Tax=Vanrija pseudolonga TaxID=143232 RepID=A0AAF0Y676_9TREE|nr:pH-response regulator protein palI/RIM9 [Vanrija pseudolonga]